MAEIKTLKALLKKLAEGSARFSHRGFEYDAKEIKSLVRTFKIYDTIDVDQDEKGKLSISWKTGKMNFKPVSK